VPGKYQLQKTASNFLPASQTVETGCRTYIDVQILKWAVS
jgi:hypothetical protein